MANLSPKTFFNELRRREVFKTAALYIVGAWVVLQVTELALPALEIPDVAIRYVWIAAILLFPLVLVFAWRYDVSTSGIRRTLPAESVDEDRALHGSDYGAIGGLSVIALGVLAVMAVQISRVEHEREFAAPANSIAVMPFEVCEGAPIDLLLARGLADEVINRLAERGKLKVIARASAQAFAGFGLSVPEIAKPLGVEYVLKGEVCRDGTTPTLTAELSDQQGFIVWSGSFTQQVNEFEQITSRLASQVADGVAAELGDVIVLQPDAPVNGRAYEQLLIGREHRKRGNEDKAREALEKALELRPDYAHAVFEIALIELSRNASMTNEGAKLREAWPVGARALELARAESQRGVSGFRARWVIATITYVMARWDQQLAWRDADKLGEEGVATRLESAQEKYREAEQHLRAAIALNPSETDMRLMLVRILDMQGPERREEALEILEGALELEPFNENLSATLANRLAGRGQYLRAMEEFARFRTLGPLSADLRFNQLEIQQNYGAYDDKFEALIDALQNEPHSFCPTCEGNSARIINLAHLGWLIASMAEIGLRQEAEALYQRVNEIPIPKKDAWWKEFFLVEFYMFATGHWEEVTEKYLKRIEDKSNEEILEAWWVRVQTIIQHLWYAGQHVRAITLAEALQHFQHRDLWIERNSWFMLSLADKYLQLERAEDAVPILEDVASYLESEYAAGMRHPDVLQNLANIYAMQKRHDEALEMLAKAVDYGSKSLIIDAHYKQMGFDFDFDQWKPVRDDPRFIRQLDRMQAIADRQAANIRALLARHDVHALIQNVKVRYEQALVNQPAAEDVNP